MTGVMRGGVPFGVVSLDGGRSQGQHLVPEVLATSALRHLPEPHGGPVPVGDEVRRPLVELELPGEAGSGQMDPVLVEVVDRCSGCVDDDAPCQVAHAW